MRRKSEVTSLINDFVQIVSTQFGKVVKTFRSDNGVEFFSSELNSFLASNGCVHQSSRPYTPEQNGVVESKHRHLLDIGRALIL